MRILTRRSSFPLWDPLAELDAFPGVAGRFFEATDGPPPIGERVAWIPPVDIAETEDEMILTAELPGMTTADIKVTVENNVLTLRGEKKAITEERSEKRRYYLFERFIGGFTRAFALPHSVDADKIVAEFENGLLKIRLPKSAVAKGRVIEVAKKK